MTPLPARAAARIPQVVAAVWGFAEATLFFVVPDVALSFLALRSRRVALLACLWAFGGALLGGTTMYLWGSLRPATAEATLEAVPGIDRQMIVRVRGEIDQLGAASVALGPLRTTPYKIYAVEGGAAGTSPTGMLAASVPSRLGRFLLVTLGVNWLAHGPLRRLSLDSQRQVLMVVWVAIYCLLLFGR